MKRSFVVGKQTTENAKALLADLRTRRMALGITDHIWTIGELIQQATEALTRPTPLSPPPSRDPETGLLPGRKPFKLRVIRGGKISASKGGSRPRNFPGPFGVVAEG